MTRAEYETKYGSSPNQQTNTPSSEPIRMTRAEYEAKYNTSPTPQPQEDSRSFAEKAIDYVPVIGSGIRAMKDVGQTINVGLYQKEAEENNKRYMTAGDQYIKIAKNTIDPKKRQMYLNLAQKSYEQAGTGIQDIVGELKTTKEILGDFGGLALDVATAGTYGQSAKLAKTGQLLEPVAKTLVPTAVSKLTSTGIKEAGKKVAGGAAIGYGYDVSQGLQSGESIGEALTPGYGTIIGAGLPALGYAVGATKEAIVGTKQIEPTVKKAIEKAVRPSVVGKSTQKQSDQYFAKAKDAVEAVVNNKNNLKYTDEFGEEVVGKLPKNLNEFTQSIEQTKKAVFEEYNALSKGTKSTVNLGNVVPELEKAAKDKVLNIKDPLTAKYAQEMADRYKNAGSLTPEETESLIQKFNEDLQSFYKNPSYGSGTKVQIDAMVANNLRKSLDDVIMKATGKEYQKLKNVYGALSTIEKDVIHRAIIDARKNNKGLIDLTNIFSYGDIATGLATGQPAIVGGGLLQRGIAAFYKLKNDPNHIIKGMFNDVEKSLKKGVKTETVITEKGINRIFPQTGKESPKEVAKTILDKVKGKGGLSIEDVSKKGSPSVGKTDPLIQEVRKPLYHGTTEGDIIGNLRPGSDGVMWFSESPNIAKSYANTNKGKVLEFGGNDKLKILDITKREPMRNETMDNLQFRNIGKYAEEAKKGGYDAIRLRDSGQGVSHYSVAVLPNGLKKLKKYQ